MSPAQDKRSLNSLEQHDEKRGSVEQDSNEKHIGLATVASYEASDMDEAMQLVGAERVAVFSEEYNLRLRRKLVSLLRSFCMGDMEIGY